MADPKFELPAGPPPVYVVLSQRASLTTEGGVMSGDTKHMYVRLSALPDELRRRVTEALKMIVSTR